MDTKNEKLSIADVVSVLSIFTISVMLFFGLVMKLDKWISLTIAALCGIFLFCLVYLAVKAKKAGEDVEKFAVVGTVLIVLYFALLLPASIYGDRYISVIHNKNKVQERLFRGCDKVDSMFVSFESLMGDRINAYKNNLESMWGTPYGRKELEAIFGRPVSDISSLPALARTPFPFMGLEDGSDCEFYFIRTQKDTIVSECRTKLCSWSIFNFSELSASVRELSSNTEKYAKTLQGFYDDYSAPTEQQNELTKYNPYKYINGNYLSIFENVPSTNVLGYLIYFILALGGIFPYLMTKRTYVPKLEKYDDSDNDFEILL